MPITLPNTTVADSYPGSSGGSQIAGTDVFASGWFTVANNPVIAQFKYGQQGQGESSPEMFLAPGTYPLFGSMVNPLNGIRFRNAVAGRAAQVWGSFFYKNDPVVSAAAEFTSSVSAGGTVTPGASSLQIQKNGVVIGSEPILDFEDANPNIWTISDDVPGTRVKASVANPDLGSADNNANTTITTFSNAALANTIVTAPAITFDGATQIYVEFSCMAVQAPLSSGARLRFWLFDGGSIRAIMALVLTPNGTAAMQVPIFTRYKFTPSAAIHTYSVRADFDLVNAQWIVAAGDPFGIGFNTPAQIRVVRT